MMARVSKKSFHVKDPDGWDCQISNGGGFAKSRKTAATGKLSAPAPLIHRVEDCLVGSLLVRRD